MAVLYNTISLHQKKILGANIPNELIYWFRFGDFHRILKAGLVLNDYKPTPEKNIGGKHTQ